MSTTDATGQKQHYNKGRGIAIARPMRGSIIRVDSPAQDLNCSDDGQRTPRTSAGVRVPLAEVSPLSTMNCASPTTISLTTNDSRRLTMPPLGRPLRKVSSGKMDSAARTDSPGQISSPANENDSPHWSAVGHATTSGKSGRVIERLMAENDRLKKDLELQLLRSQELERNIQTIRPQLDALRAENSNLSHLKSVDGSLLSRRDRKIETLKEELSLERSRREANEALARRLTTERDDVAETARRDVQQAHEEAKHSTTHASILEQSHRQLATDYRTRAERWRKDINDLETDRRAERQKLARLEVVAEQMRTELERSRKAHSEFSDQFGQYRAATEGWKDELEKIVLTETNRSQALSDDMQTVVDKMRWVMSIHTAQELKRPISTIDR